MVAVTSSGSVQRLDFGRRLGLGSHGTRHSSGFGSVLTDLQIKTSGELSSATSAVARELMRHDMELGKGPYADKGGAVGWLLNDVKEIVTQASECKPTTDDVLHCVMDVLRPYGCRADRQLQRKYLSERHNFLLSEDAVIDGPEPACAGDLLTDVRRGVMEAGTGRYFTLLTSVMEPLFIATSLLRRFELDAYPALAAMEPEAGAKMQYAPVMAIVNLDGPVSLHTFSLLGRHPPMDSLILIGDDAMQGVAWAVVARKLVNKAALEIVGPDGASPLHSLRPELDAIAHALFQCYKAWPGSLFIEDALGFMRRKITETLAQIAILALDRDAAMPTVLKQTVFSRSDFVLDFISPIAESKTNDYANVVIQGLASMVKKTPSD